MTHDKGQGGTLTPCLPTTPPTDWELRRYETASRILASMVAGHGGMPVTEWHYKAYAQYAVAFTDALIAELKKEGGEQ